MSPRLIGDTVTLCRPPAAQPLTRWSETVKGRTFHFRTPPRRQVRCHRCRRRRWARNLSIIAQAWYDPMIVCADGCRRAARRRR